MIKTLFISCACLIAALSASAQTKVKDCIKYETISGNELKVVGVVKADTLEGVVNIPSSVDGKNVVAIGDEAFSKQERVSKIVFPATVRQIGKNIAPHCFALKNYGVEAGSQYLSVVDGVLFTKDGSRLLSCPSGRGELHDNTGVSEYVIPANVTSVAPGAFGTCKNLKRITCSDAMTEIEEGTFNGCWGLDIIIFPKNLKKIGRHAFANTIVQKFTFPASLEEIEDEAFMNNSIFEIHVQGKTPAKLGKDVWGSKQIYMRLYVPLGYKKAYQKADGWDYFEEFYEEGTHHHYTGKKI